MDFTLSETSKGKKSLLYDGFAFRIDRVLKSGVENQNIFLEKNHSSLSIYGHC
jgi:hypothetical protein